MYVKQNLQLFGSIWKIIPNHHCMRWSAEYSVLTIFVSNYTCIPTEPATTQTPTTTTTPTPTLAETCRALDTFVDNVQLLSCIRNDQCNGIYCNVTDAAVQSFISTANITLLPCNQPPAFRLSTSGSTVLDRVISQSVNISLPGGITLRVTLDHLTNAVGVGVS